MRLLSKERTPGHRATSQQLEELRLNLSVALPHEFRTPLNAILGYSEYLLSRGPERLPEADMLLRIQSSIYDNALRLQHLIDNYLLYAHLKILEQNPEKREHEMRENRETVYTHTFISSLAKGIAGKMKRGADLQMQLDDAWLYIGARNLSKIVEELVENAFKFSAPGTSVSIATECRGPFWRFQVADQGRGMTPEQISKIGAFMQFERPHYEQQGAGLGLTIVELLTRFNHGRVTMESLPGVGTTVAVELQLVSFLP